jgi:hypothetical protein
LVAACDQRGAGCRANGRIGVTLKKPDSVRGDVVDVRRLDVWPAVTGDIGIAHIVGHDEDDVRRTGWNLRSRIANSPRKYACPDGRVAQEHPACEL